MALQQINWTQINTSLVPSGSIIDLGNETGSLNAVYADNLYVSGLSLADFIGQAGTTELNLYTASLKDAIETTGSNLTVKGNLLVKGSTTAVNSTTVSIGDNIIELNGTAATNGGLLIKDPTAPSISGSLLWDTTNNKWIGGQLGDERTIALLSTGLTQQYLLKYGIDGQLRTSRVSDNIDFQIHLHDTGTFIVQGDTFLSGNVILGHREFTENNEHHLIIGARLSSSLYPHGDDLYELGSGSLRFKTIYTNTGSISRIENITNPSDGVWIQGIGDVSNYSSSVDDYITNVSSSLAALNLSQIADGGATASISNTQGLRVNRNTEITGSLIVTSGSAVFNSQVTAESSNLILTSGSSLIIKDGGNFNITGSSILSGSVTIKGDLRVEGKTTLVQTDDANVESLIVSGAMSIVQNQINSQIISASLSIQSLGSLADLNSSAVIDLGGF